MNNVVVITGGATLTKEIIDKLSEMEVVIVESEVDAMQLTNPEIYKMIEEINFDEPEEEVSFLKGKKMDRILGRKY